MKEERKAVLTFDLAKAMYEGNDEQLRQLALSTFPELNKPKITRWEELESFGGIWVDNNGNRS